MHKLTDKDFILKEYDWVKVSEYALTKDNILLRYDKDKVGFPFYQCLYQGYWEATDIGISYQDIANAKPITEEQAKDIISKEEKPASSRPPERNNWISC